MNTNLIPTLANLGLTESILTVTISPVDGTIVFCPHPSTQNTLIHFTNIHNLKISTIKQTYKIEKIKDQNKYQKNVVCKIFINSFNKQINEYLLSNCIFVNKFHVCKQIACLLTNWHIYKQISIFENKLHVCQQIGMFANKLTYLKTNCMFVNKLAYL